MILRISSTFCSTSSTERALVGICMMLGVRYSQASLTIMGRSGLKNGSPPLMLNIYTCPNERKTFSISSIVSSSSRFKGLSLYNFQIAHVLHLDWQAFVTEKVRFKGVPGEVKPSI